LSSGGYDNLAGYEEDHEAKGLKRKDFLQTTCLSLYKKNLFAKNGKQFLQS